MRAARGTCSLAVAGYLVVLCSLRAGGDIVRGSGQFGQDSFVVNRVYGASQTSEVPGSPPRYFIELGAVDGFEFSNTLVLEQALGWRGLCIEPSSAYEALVASNRTCIKSDACVGPRSGDTVRFVDAGEKDEVSVRQDGKVVLRMANVQGVFNGIVDYLDKFEVTGATTEKTTKTLEEVLDGVGAPARIDYLSLDTEGSEFSILVNFPFHRYTLGVISVEHNHVYPKRENIRRLLASHGLVHAQCAQVDDLYVRTMLRASSHFSAGMCAAVTM